ncbi:VOC family protein [Gordonia insulae]|uniref:Manganese-dependent 2,3-dihydroxybiphenyl 1,2-dioxygenase n=1 Tax=Gordonia insulae TaxID=2420509 RepID=A0A3G8JMC8_9ACTN|nr:VOC family protein [Gordonia insulae]AZG46226.1 Manganese-dependent 2,3-dihydroxybiphenyl 1,2-dioxygenase [Gordonia insulae]
MNKYLAGLVHIEITTPDVDGSADFYTRKFGMREFARRDGRVYLRCWGDYQPYSVVLVPGAQPGLHQMAWRTTSSEALEEAAARVEQAGIQGTWTDGGLGYGRAFEFTGPYGHPMRLVFDVDDYEADAEHRSIYPDRPEMRSAHAGAPRFLDHVTIAATDVRGFCEWYAEVLDYRIMGYTELDDAPITVFGVLTTNEKSHDLGVVLDTSSTPGRVNHLAFWVDTYEELVICAQVLLERGTDMEYGPSVHGIGEQNFLYFREPSTMRVELNSGGYRNYVPGWEPKVWKPSDGSNNIFRNSAMPMSMTESFPAADGFTATEEGVSDEMKAELLNPYAQHGRG